MAGYIQLSMLRPVTYKLRIAPRTVEVFADLDRVGVGILGATGNSNWNFEWEFISSRPDLIDSFHLRSQTTYNFNGHFEIWSTQRGESIGRLVDRSGRLFRKYVIDGDCESGPIRLRCLWWKYFPSSLLLATRRPYEVSGCVAGSILLESNLVEQGLVLSLNAGQNPSPQVNAMLLACMAILERGTQRLREAY